MTPKREKPSFLFLVVATASLVLPASVLPIWGQRGSQGVPLWEAVDRVFAAVKGVDRYGGQQKVREIFVDNLPTLGIVMTLGVLFAYLVFAMSTLEPLPAPRGSCDGKEQEES